MPCNWLLVGDTKLCKNPVKGQYCATHTFKIRKSIIIPQPVKDVVERLNRVFSFVFHVAK
ncbi:22216_t:CDS:1, partial [Racocetra persica]